MNIPNLIKILNSLYGDDRKYEFIKKNIFNSINVNIKEIPSIIDCFYHDNSKIDVIKYFNEGNIFEKINLDDVFNILETIFSDGKKFNVFKILKAHLVIVDQNLFCEKLSLDIDNGSKYYEICKFLSLKEEFVIKHRPLNFLSNEHIEYSQNMYYKNMNDLYFAQNINHLMMA